MKNIYKLLKITGAILIFLMPLMIFSGFFMTKNWLVPWLNYNVAATTHKIILPILLLPVLYLHSLAGALIGIQRSPSINNKTIKITIVIVWTLLLTITAYFFFATAPSATPAASQNAPSQYRTSNTIMNDSFNNKRIDSLPTFTLAEITAHNTPDDCWIIINNKVYDVTSKVLTHPGGTKNITNYCGKNATNAFNTKNTGIPHSTQAHEMLNNLLAGQYIQ